MVCGAHGYAWPKRVRGESEIGALQVRLHSTTRSVDLVPADSACRIAPGNLPCHQPAQAALVDGANLDLRSAPLRRSTYPLPPRLLFALTSEPQDNRTQPQAPLPAYTQTSFLIPTLPSLRRPWLGERVETLRPRLKRGPTANSPPERAHGEGPATARIRRPTS